MQQNKINSSHSLLVLFLYSILHSYPMRDGLDTLQNEWMAIYYVFFIVTSHILYNKSYSSLRWVCPLASLLYWLCSENTFYTIQPLNNTFVTLCFVRLFFYFFVCGIKHFSFENVFSLYI